MHWSTNTHLCGLWNLQMLWPEHTLYNDDLLKRFWLKTKLVVYFILVFLIMTWWCWKLNKNQHRLICWMMTNSHLPISVEGLKYLLLQHVLTPLLLIDLLIFFSLFNMANDSERHVPGYGEVKVASWFLLAPTGALRVMMR